MRSARITAVMLCFVSSAIAAQGPWVGTWKLDRARSVEAGLIYTVVKHGSQYQYTFPAVTYSIADDGKDWPVFGNRAASLQPAGLGEWVQVLKVDGHEVERAHMTLSADGRTLTKKTTGTGPDGRPFTSEAADRRIRGGPGLAGTWKEGSDSRPAVEVLQYSDAGGGRLRMENLNTQMVMVTALDGKPAPSEGPRAVPGMTAAYTRTSPRKLRYTGFVQGKAVYTGEATLSRDGKEFQDVNWLVGQPAQKTVNVYIKQP